MITPAYAQAAGGPAGGGDFFVSLLPLILIFAVFWFLLIRPQQKKMKEHQQMLQSLRKGDRVVTGGGIIGRIVKVDDQDNTVTLEIAQGVQVRVVKPTIAERLDKQPQPANQPAPSSSGSGGGLLARLFPSKKQG